MTQVYLSEAALNDVLRLEEFLHQTQDPLANQLIDYLFDALQVLTHQPGIGRPVADGMRELIISRGRSGYLARYRLDETQDLVRVARIRHQRESGYGAEEL